MAALIRPYLAAGIVTVKNLRQREAESESAASYRRASVIDKATSKIMNACGKLEYTVEIMMPIGPYTDLAPSQLFSTPCVPNHCTNAMALTSEGPNRGDKPIIFHSTRSGTQERCTA